MQLPRIRGRMCISRTVKAQDESPSTRNFVMTRRIDGSRDRLGARYLPKRRPNKMSDTVGRQIAFGFALLPRAPLPQSGEAVM